MTPAEQEHFDKYEALTQRLGVEVKWSWSLGNSVSVLKHVARYHLKAPAPAPPPSSLPQAPSEIYMTQVANERPQLIDLCTQHGVTIVNEPSKPSKEWPDMQAWRSTLAFEGRTYATDFHQGSAHKAPPTAADVLNCLLSDASSVENTGSFEEWCSDFGYNTDSRKAERAYKACEATVAPLREFLGELYETFVNAEH